MWVERLLLSGHPFNAVTIASYRDRLLRRLHSSCMHAAQPSASEARVQERSLAFLLAFTRYLSTLVLAINSTSAVGTAVGTYFF